MYIYRRKICSFGDFVKKKLFGFCLALLAVSFAACSLDNDGEAEALAAWLSDQGMQDSYAVKTLEISSVPVVSAESFHDDAPSPAYTYGAFGASMGKTRDLYFDFAFNFTKGNKRFIGTFQRDSAAYMYLRLFPLRYFYEQLADSLPLTEDLELEVSWKLDLVAKNSQLDSIVGIADSVWYEEIASWTPVQSFDTTYSWNFSGDSLPVFLVLPDSFTTALQDTTIHGGRLQMRLSAPNASRAYRFYGNGFYAYTPTLRMVTGDSAYNLNPFRSAMTAIGEPESSTMLYGGSRDSLIVEFDGSKIMEALAEFYGDEFPLTSGNGMDVRQAVVLAQFSVAKDDSQGESELGLPIQAVASSFYNAYAKDSSERRITESYKLDNETIKATGHPNLIFYDKSDSLTIQVTYGMRDFINRGSEIENLKVMLRLGYPVLAPQDTVYGDYITTKGDTVFFFMNYFDYAKYDFASAFANGVNMKLWLLSKRGEEE